MSPVGFEVGSVAKLLVPIPYKLMIYGFSSASSLAIESVAKREPVPAGAKLSVTFWLLVPPTTTFALQLYSEALEPLKLAPETVRF